MLPKSPGKQQCINHRKTAKKQRSSWGWEHGLCLWDTRNWFKRSWKSAAGKPQVLELGCWRDIQRQQFRVWKEMSPCIQEMATHSSILAWKIPRTEEPGGLQSMGCRELDTTERLSTHTFMWPSTVTSCQGTRAEIPDREGHLVLLGWN